MSKNKKKSSSKDIENPNENDVAESRKRGTDEKPLPKLVLKVGKEKKSKSENLGSVNPDTEHVHHKKKKKKHKHSKTEDNGEKSEKKSRKREATDVVESEPPTKRIHARKEKEKKPEVKEPEVPPFNHCLENLHRNLQRKDIYGIFTFPVTDLIAPGYSKIIKQPMDFNTMLKKIENNEYHSIEQFKDNFVVMCNNAMLYNGSDTIYYKSAEKMLSLGLKMMSHDKIKKMHKSVGIPVSDDDDDIIQIDESSDVNIDSVYSAEEYSPKKRTPDKKRKDTSKLQSAISASILAAAREARQKLLKKHPKQLYGYLSKDDKGNTALNVLNPDTSEEKKSVPVNLGDIAGKLKTGIPSGQIVFREDKKTKVVPVSYLMYGPYGSFGPSHDSSLSNLSKEDSNLLLQTYGTENGIFYARSLLRFTKDAPLARDHIERILDTVTGSNYSKLAKLSAKKKSSTSESTTESSNPSTTPNTQTPSTTSNIETQKKQEEIQVDMNSLMSLNDLGIDTSFLKSMVKTPAETSSQQKDSTASSEVVVKLDENVSLLQNLRDAQNERFSKKQDGTLPDEEIKIATTLTNNFKELISMVAPKDIVSSEGAQTAIGLTDSSKVSPQQIIIDSTINDDITAGNRDTEMDDAAAAIQS